MGRDISVGVEIRYGLDGPGIESRCRQNFPHPSRLTLGPTSLLFKGYRVCPGGKAAVAWRWPLTPSSAKVESRVQLYLYSHSGPSWPVGGRTLPSTFNHPQYKSHSFCYAVKFSVLSLAFRQAALLGNCDSSCKIFHTNVISDERRIMSVFSYEAHESRMQRGSLPHLVNSVENPDRCWTLNITCHVQACMMKVKLHAMTAEFVTAKIFSCFSNRWGTVSKDYKPTPNGAWDGISTQSVSVFLISSAYTTYEIISGWSRSAGSATDYVFLVEVVL